jgi:hypothetical protein
MKPFVAPKTVAEKYTLTFIIAICVLVHSCKKTGEQQEVPPPDPPGSKIGLLKDVVAQHLPSPLYHFDYTDSGVTTGINFASGFYIYQLSYLDKRLDQMVNLPNNNALHYTYKNGSVTSIREVRPNNSIVWHYTFAYNNNNQVKEIRWNLASKSGADSLLYRKVLLSYNGDGNLQRYIDYRDITGKSLDWIQTVEYKNYDQGKNVDDFSVLKEFHDHLLYLPGVRLQKNNPKTVLITGVQNDYEITNTWTYQNGVPVSKSAKVKQTKGSDAGNEIVVGTTYSYY